MKQKQFDHKFHTALTNPLLPAYNMHFLPRDTCLLSLKLYPPGSDRSARAIFPNTAGRNPVHRHSFSTLSILPEKHASLLQPQLSVDANFQFWKFLGMLKLLLEVSCRHFTKKIMPAQCVQRGSMLYSDTTLYCIHEPLHKHFYMIYMIQIM